jgi:hypothetical protein
MMIVTGLCKYLVTLYGYACADVWTLRLLCMSMELISSDASFGIFLAVNITQMNGALPIIFHKQNE